MRVHYGGLLSALFGPGPQPFWETCSHTALRKNLLFWFHVTWMHMSNILLVTITRHLQLPILSVRTRDYNEEKRQGSDGRHGTAFHFSKRALVHIWSWWLLQGRLPWGLWCRSLRIEKQKRNLNILKTITMMVLNKTPKLPALGKHLLSKRHSANALITCSY